MKTKFIVMALSIIFSQNVFAFGSTSKPNNQTQAKPVVAKTVTVPAITKPAVIEVPKPAPSVKPEKVTKIEPYTRKKIQNDVLNPKKNTSGANISRKKIHVNKPVVVTKVKKESAIEPVKDEAKQQPVVLAKPEQPSNEVLLPKTTATLKGLLGSFEKLKSSVKTGSENKICTPQESAMHVGGC